jgi:hypothetical protein
MNEALKIIIYFQWLAKFLSCSQTFLICLKRCKSGDYAECLVIRHWRGRRAEMWYGSMQVRNRCACLLPCAPSALTGVYQCAITGGLSVTCG